MKHINEEIGYINPNIFNLTYIVNDIISFIISNNKWDNNYIVNNKKNTRDIDGFAYHTFTYDLKNDKLGSIKIILVNVLDTSVTSYKFSGFINNEDVAFYSPVDSIIDESLNNCGYIYVSYNYFQQWQTDKELLEEELQSYIYHELRHYYDNIIGVFDGSIKELLHITLIADELNINDDSFTQLLKDNDIDRCKRAKSLKTILYLSDPTELNAWYHSFTMTLRKIKKLHPEYTPHDFIKYILEHGTEYNSFIIYNYAIIYKKINNYMSMINGLCGNDPIFLFYYISKTLSSCKISDNILKKFNNIFEEKYMSVFDDDINEELFGNKLNKFCNDHFCNYIYNYIAPKYLHTIKNMLKFISSL